MRFSMSKNRFLPLALTVMALFGTSLLSIVQPASPRASAATASPSFIQTWAAENENSSHVRTRDQAVADAQNFDVIVANPKTYASHMSAMRTANPALKVYAYLNGTFAQENQGSTFPTDWYSRDAAGNKVRSKGYGNYLMKPTSSGWITNRISLCKSMIASSGYDGCMLDMLGTAPTRPGYTTALPINPSTNKAWVPTDWQKATAALASKVDVAIPQTVWGNGYGSGSRYYDSTWGPSRLLSPGVHGAHTESWIRTSTMSITSFRTESEWKKSVDMLRDLAAQGERTSVMLKLWTSATTAQKDAYHRYALATFLLGSNGQSAFNASYGSDVNSLTYHRYWNVAIGTPTTAYAKIGGVYKRSFTNGIVLVNPTKTSQTVSLGGTFVDLNGTTRSSITLAPNTGDVMVRK